MRALVPTYRPEIPFARTYAATGLTRSWIVGTSILWSLAPSAVAECIDYASYLHWVSSLELGAPFDVVAADETVYVAGGPEGLLVVDVSDPLDPMILAALDTPSWAAGLALDGATGFVADVSSLEIVDLSDPGDPRPLGSVATPGDAVDVAVSSGFAYVADSGWGLRVVDVSDPESPFIVQTVSLPTFRVALEGTYAYLLGSSTLHVVDVSTPTDPIVVGELTDLGPVADLVVSGSLAYVVGNGLDIIDVGDPTTPTLLGHLESGSGRSVAVQGDVAFLANGFQSGFETVDVSDPTTPTLVGGTWVPDQASGVAVSNGFAYVIDEGYEPVYVPRLHVIAIARPDTAPVLGTFAFRTKALDVRDRLAFVGDDDDRFQVVDVSDVESPVTIGDSPLDLRPRHIRVSGDHAFVSGTPAFGDSLSLQIVNVASPGDPHVVGGRSSSLRYDVIAVRGSHLYVGAERDTPRARELHIFDVTSPADPHLTRVLALDEPVTDLAFSGSIAYVAAARMGVLVVDVETPSNAEILNVVEVPFSASGVALSGVHLLVADVLGGLLVFDVSNPTEPDPVASWPTPDEAIGVRVLDHTAYVTEKNPTTAYARCHVLDVTDPIAPTVTGNFEIYVTAAVSLTDELLFVLGNSPTRVEVRPLQCEDDATPTDPDPPAFDPPRLFTIGPASPSPMSDRVRVAIGLERSRDVRARVHDVAGRRVEVIHDGPLPRGRHVITWTSTGHAAGVYYLDVLVDGVRSVRRLVVLR